MPKILTTWFMDDPLLNFFSYRSQLHNGSLYLLPFTQDPNGLFHRNSQLHHHESRVRCRATNAYGKIVSPVITVKPGRKSKL